MIENLKAKFIEYLQTLNIYPTYLTGDRKCSNFITEIEYEYEQSFGTPLFQVPEGKVPAFVAALRENLRQKDSSFREYSNRKGSGIPNAILNTHFINFLLGRRKLSTVISVEKPVKKNRLQKLVSLYLDYMKSSGGLEGNSEMYKWQLCFLQRGRPDITVENFEQEIRDLDFTTGGGNGALCYPPQITAIRNMAHYETEAYRQCFVRLFNEEEELQQRISDFKVENNEIWSRIAGRFEGKTSSMCDERIISTFLTFHDPDDYTFYMDSVYKAYCQYLQVPTEKSGRKLVHFYELLEPLVENIQENDELLQLIQKEVEVHHFPVFVRLIAQDILWHLKSDHLVSNNSTEDAEEKEDTPIQTACQMKEVKLLRQKKQIILQGAPGTGKTYRTASLAVALCDDVDTRTMNRDQLMARYAELCRDKRIAFTTFHQSLDYEEFVEGIRSAVDEEGHVTYQIKDGIFKTLCKEAESVDVGGIPVQPTIWKVSLQGTGDNPTRTDCMQNDRIRIGWDEYGPTIDDSTDYFNGGRVVLDTFMNKMQVGDYVLSCYSYRTIDAIGIVTGEYEWLDDVPNYKRSRKVKWLVKGINEDIYDMNNQTTMTLSSVYKLNFMDYTKLSTLLKKHHAKGLETTPNNKPYVLIIDEINRGNISKIFGELITLLEADKRRGKLNAQPVKLTYSGEEFCVPDNLYLIGTMNTADRSVGYIDYAVRRRFAFVSLVSDRNVIEDYYNDDNLCSLALDYYDRVSSWMHVPSDYNPADLMVGHSYFLAADEEELRNKMVYEVRPLLLEYLNDGLINLHKDSDEYQSLLKLGEE